jgi:tripartite ATP-independent transporter DctP family solute receptor
MSTNIGIRSPRGAARRGRRRRLAAPAVLRAQAPVRLTLGHGAAPGNPRSVAAERMAAQLREKSNGRIEMRVAGSAQLGDDAAMLTALRTGTLDMSVNSQGASSAVLPELAAFGLPFLFPGPAAAYKVVDGPTGAELAQRFEKVGLISLGWWDNGIRHITNSKRPITRPEDLRGLKIRTPPDPTTIDIFQALGAATQQVNFNELYVALQQGVVDGQENPLANIHSAKLYEVNKFISLSSHQWQCNPSSPRASPGAGCGRRTSASCRTRRRRPRPTSGPFRRRPTRGCSASTAPTRRSR